MPSRFCGLFQRRCHWVDLSGPSNCYMVVNCGLERIWRGIIVEKLSKATKCRSMDSRCPGRFSNQSISEKVDQLPKCRTKYLD